MEYVVAISGLDPSGKAGLLLDCCVMRAQGIWAAGIASALTVQNFRVAKGFTPVETKIISDQLELLFESGLPKAVKIGMLPNAEIAETIFSALEGKNIPIVLDPILSTADGLPFIEPQACIRILEKFGKLITVLTPNWDEVTRLSEIRKFVNVEIPAFAEFAFSTGIKAVVFKGGHLLGEEIVDRLVIHDGTEKEYARKRLKFKPRGTGCALSSAITAFLGLGETVVNAFTFAENFMDRFLTNPLNAAR